jgi:glycosyltransferase involved in cell wall biosynthesis
MLFSAVIIARNEEKTLPRLLKSLAGVDEIVVVDTGSTDKTVEVAKEYGAKVEEVGDRFVITADITTAWTSWGLLKDGDKAFDFASARNYAASLAKNDMIFMPDADEVVEWNLENIPEADRLEYNFYYAMDDEGKPTIQFIHSKFYNRLKYKWVRITHEVLEGVGETKFTDQILLKHFQNKETNRSQYLPGLALDYCLNPYNDRNTHYLARELMYNKQYEKAIKFFARHLEHQGWLVEQGQSCIYTGDCYKSLGKENEAKEWYYKALGYELRREPLIALGQLHFDKKEWREAKAYYELALRVERTNYYGNIEDNYTHLPHGQLSVCLYWLGEKEKSLEHLKKALEYAPNNETYLNNLKFY